MTLENRKWNIKNKKWKNKKWKTEKWNLGNDK
jgi:hypothetical protein